MVVLLALGHHAPVPKTAVPLTAFLAFWGYLSLEAAFSTYAVAFNQLDSNHRGIRVSIQKSLIFGFNPPALTNPSLSRRKTQDG